MTLKLAETMDGVVEYSDDPSDLEEEDLTEYQYAVQSGKAVYNLRVFCRNLFDFQRLLAHWSREKGQKHTYKL